MPPDFLTAPTIKERAKLATLKGTSGANTLTGATGIDSIYGYGGNDSLYGRAGNDSIWGGDGIDKMWGEAGKDTLRGENQDDHIYAGDGDDLVYGGAGNDQLFGDGGTDKVYGDAGNDILKGGTGKAFLYGGTGNDSLYYGPTSADIGKIGGHFYDSILDGGAGTDTLHIYNSSTFGSAKTPAHTNIFMADNAVEGFVYFSEHSGDTGVSETALDLGQRVGKFTGIEHLTLTGKGGATYTSVWDQNPTSVTGTEADDFFSVWGAPTKSTTYKGGAGNDTFWVSVNDKIISETNDNDLFSFRSFYDGDGNNVATVTGFNGIGKAGGDIAQFSKDDFTNPSAQITRANGWTTFKMDTGDMVKIQGVGLAENLDYFIS